MLIFHTRTQGLDPARARCRGRSRSAESAFAYSLLLYALGLDELPRLALDGAGKPYFPDLPSVHFSLSHTKGLVLAAVSDRPVGADAQLIEPARAGRLQEALMTETERRDFDFFTLWTLREAAFKLDGTGDLRSMRFSRSGGRILGPDPSVRFRCYSLPSCAAAAACREGQFPETLTEVPADKICS